MENNRVRIIDIAEELGLSTATVSNVIHGKTKKISDETVKRVQALLEERQYIPSMAGILLAQNNSHIIGVVIHDHEKYEGRVLEDAFVARALNDLEHEIDAAGFFMMVRTTKEWNSIIQFASMWNLEGLILIGFCEQDYKKLREKMRIPFIVYDGYFEETDRICNLTLDHYDGGRQMGIYFKEQGYQRVLCITDNDECMDHERFDGFQKGFLGDSRQLLIPMTKQERHQFYVEHLDELRAYDAIFAVSDIYAIELMQFLQSTGLCIPQNIAIAGFDDNPICESVYPTLTTIRQNGSERARLALEILQNLKEGSQSKGTVKLAVELVVRESTGQAFSVSESI
ncbi:MAG: LacI family DNA-binding transcriptional regulator [bacterium]|nr:LacI family DNA-binding transcriptional regulator [bacterium]